MHNENLIAVRTGVGCIFVPKDMVIGNDTARLVRTEIAVTSRLVSIAAGLLGLDDMELVDCIFYDMFDENEQRGFAEEAIGLMDGNHLSLDEACEEIGKWIFQEDDIKGMSERLRKYTEAD